MESNRVELRRRGIESNLCVSLKPLCDACFIAIKPSTGHWELQRRAEDWKSMVRGIHYNAQNLIMSIVRSKRLQFCWVEWHVVPDFSPSIFFSDFSFIFFFLFVDCWKASWTMLNAGDLCSTFWSKLPEICKIFLMQQRNQRVEFWRRCRRGVGGQN